MTTPLTIELSWPAEELSPNARVHHMVAARFKKAAKIEAGWATKIAMPMRWAPDSLPLSVHIEAHPPLAWRTGDPDNLVSRLKAAIDGISGVIGVNDRNFEAPTVSFADRCKNGKIYITISTPARAG